MTDGDALLRAIREHPDEDTPRLAYADWLDERGGEPNRGRAEFIRVQCEAWGPPLWTRQQLAIRATQLLYQGEGVLGSWFAWPKCPAVRTQFLERTRFDNHFPVGGEIAVFFARGFPAAVRCRLAVWLDHAPRIAERFPIADVRLTDRAPMRTWRRVRGHDSSWAAPDRAECYEWHRATTEAALSGEPDYVPEPIFDAMAAERKTTFTLDPNLTVPLTIRHDTAADAMRALSRGCVRAACSPAPA